MVNPGTYCSTPCNKHLPKVSITLVCSCYFNQQLLYKSELFRVKNYKSELAIKFYENFNFFGTLTSLECVRATKNICFEVFSAFIAQTINFIQNLKNLRVLSLSNFEVNSNASKT